MQAREKCQPDQTRAVPRIGSLVYDEVREVPCVVRDFLHGRLYLRSPGGGREWTANPGRVRPPDEA